MKRPILRIAPSHRGPRFLVTALGSCLAAAALIAPLPGAAQSSPTAPRLNTPSAPSQPELRSFSQSSDGRVATPAPSSAASGEDEKMRSLTDQILGGLPKPAEEPQPAGDRDKMRSMTADVLSSLYTLGEADRAGVSADDQAAELRQQLADLVAKAQEAGESPEYVAALIDEALAENPNRALPAALSNERGELDTQALIAVIVTEQARRDQAADPYIAALMAEGESQSTGAINRSGVDDTRAKRAFLEALAERKVDEYYIVRSGDTLGSIAQRSYGDAFMYRKIYNANRDILRSPNFIEVGQRLYLP
ncbi:MAG: LysM peptidoglycan-binding domain-containing protein [Neomegalonema sp.]|nr:LysM peptidoglycan-binding domain-containing protein [Neomegalonema sp.]